MPPKTAGEKRKRGRPPNAPKIGDASQESSRIVEAESNELAEKAVVVSTPAKRGRPKKNKESQPPPLSEEPQAKRRGRPRREEGVEEVIEEEPELVQSKIKSRKAVKSAVQVGDFSQPAEKPTVTKTSRKAAQEASGARGDDEASVNSAAKKKRGRPTKVIEEPTEDVTELEPTPKKKRGRPSLNKGLVAQESIEAAEEESAPKKRGSKPKEKIAEVEKHAAEEEVETEPAPEKKRGRKPKAAAEEGEKPSAEEESKAAKKKHRRPAARTEPEAPEARRRKDRQPSPAGEPATEKPTKKRRKRPSEIEERPSKSPPETQRRRPGRPRISDGASSPHAPEEQPSKSRKSKKRPPGDEDAADSAPAKKRRRRTSDEIRQQQQLLLQSSMDPPAARRPAPKHRHIAPRVRQIPRSIIEEKWTPLAPPTLAHVSSLLRLAERPVLQRLAANEKRRDQAASAIRLVTNRLSRKLSRGLPFPPAAAPSTGSGVGTRKAADADGGRAEELNFERVIEGVAALERQLDPLLHAVELLKVEKERDERSLEADYDSLRTLEANARSEARNFKDNLRKTHVLVPEPKKVAGADSSRHSSVGEEHDFKFVPDENVTGMLFRDLEGNELRELAGQVSSHMESMRNNLQQIDGVLPQIVRSRAALQDVLFKHLDQPSYENVLLG
ncbi:Putative centromere protein Q [Colletotrichum destructivum]|uniref:Centromere protein Q n=1 Tax=Colletotrichum destructivum TaxID=34406 RepID=A0AAX4IHF8_9PEZI|nr:Putative centromere protein Q [Colletotrichum destructivum]